LVSLLIILMVVTGLWTVYSPLPGKTARIVLAASAGREASEFSELSNSLVAAGYRTVSIEAPAVDSSPPNEFTVDFDRMEAHSAPVGFTQARTGRGSTGAWEVREDNTAPSGKKVLAQTSSDPTNYRFPLCIYDAFEARDVDLRVFFKPLSGRVDQAAGLVWRYQDTDNYYVVRANALEGNVVLYKVENGKRSDLKPQGAWFAYGKDAPVPLGVWSSLRVVVRSNTFSVWLNGNPLFDVEDETFTSAGRLGLWTKADSVTLFDTLTARSL
jgi:hypothetical protein